jgi:hypothetical protein
MYSGMEPSAKHGTNYGTATSNVDPETGIRYGVISQHTLNGDASNEIFTEGAVYFPYCPHCNEVWECDVNSREVAVADVCPFCRKDVDEWGYGDEPSYIEYHETTPDGEIIIIDCLDSDYMIIKSPYVTKGSFCSPCVPGGIDLDSPNQDGEFAYCLPDDFFEDKAPYEYSTSKQS